MSVEAKSALFGSPGQVPIQLFQGAAQDPYIKAAHISKGSLRGLILDILVPETMRKVVCAHICDPLLKQPVSARCAVLTEVVIF